MKICVQFINNELGSRGIETDPGKENWWLSRK